MRQSKLKKHLLDQTNKKCISLEHPLIRPDPSLTYCYWVCDSKRNARVHLVYKDMKGEAQGLGKGKICGVKKCTGHREECLIKVGTSFVAARRADEGATPHQWVWRPLCCRAATEALGRVARKRHELIANAPRTPWTNAAIFTSLWKCENSVTHNALRKYRRVVWKGAGMW